ncbi:hypothetical protein FSST1_010212 [Fusarium sambucinum]
MANPEYIYCTICGMTLGDDNCVVYSGPHWPGADFHSRKVSDQELTRYEAEAESQYGKAALPTGQIVYPPEAYDEHERDEHLPDGVAPAKMYIAVHPACEDMAKRVIETSSIAKVHSIGDLWLALERRCAGYLHWAWQQQPRRRDERFIPPIPYNTVDEPGLHGYYAPLHCLEHWGDEWEGWWDENPVNIPNLTTDLMSNLERVEPTLAPKLKELLELSPNEIKNHINTFVQDGEFSLDCNYLMPQSMWAEVFFHIPFLWDLNIDTVYKKTGSSKDDLERWNWEKLTRQVMSRAEISHDVKPWVDDEEAWDYSDVGLNVPGGFANRRRIWQILEELHPDVALWRHQDCRW